MICCILQRLLENALKKTYLKIKVAKKLIVFILNFNVENMLTGSILQ